MGLGSSVDSDVPTLDRRPPWRAAFLHVPDVGSERTGPRAAVEVTEDAVVVHLVGRLDTPGSMQLWSLLRRLRVDRPWLVLDLASVPEIEPYALDVVFATQRVLRHGRCRLALWHVRAQPLDLVRRRGLQRFVDIVSGPLEAWLARHKAPSPPPQRTSAASGNP